MIVRNTGSGVRAGGSTHLNVLNCTIADNATAGFGLYHGNNLVVSDSILWNNGNDLILGSGSTVAADHCDISDGDFLGLRGNLSIDPRFVPGRHHDYYLSQTAAGHGDPTSDDRCPFAALRLCARTQLPRSV